MVLRRHKGLIQLVFVIFIICATVRYSYKYYQDNSMKLKAANRRRYELIKEVNKANRDLDVMTQRKDDLEYALKSKTLELSKYKKECQAVKDNLENQANRDKTQSLARFNALDSEHRMLKAKRDDLQTEHEHLQKNFDRLKNDHSKVEEAYKKNQQELKEKNEKVISALQYQVEYYQKQEHSLQTKIKELKDTVVKYQGILDNLKERKATIKDIPEKTGGGDDNAGHALKEDEEKAANQKVLLSKTRKRRSAHHARIKDGSIERITDVIDNKLDDSKKGNTKLQESLKDKKVVLNNDTDVMIVPGGGKDTVEVGDTKHDEKHRGKNSVEQDVEGQFKNQEQLKNDILGTNKEERQGLVEGEDKKVKEIQMNNFKEEDDLLNNDQKFDDQELALHEVEENDENAADGLEKNDVLMPGNDGGKDRV